MVSEPDKSKLRTAAIATGVLGVLWLACWADWQYFHQLTGLVGRVVSWSVFTAGVVVSLVWLWWGTRPQRRSSRKTSAFASACAVVLCQYSVFVADAFGLGGLRATLARASTAIVFVLGLAWVIWWVDSFAYDRARQRGRSPDQDPQDRPGKRIWDPRDTQAWYYGTKNRKLNQSVTTLLGYSLSFLLVFMLLTQVGGCHEVYEMPAGGGQQQAIAQTVKVQRVIQKKYVINPFSSIKFNVRDLDDVKLQFDEITEHAYTVGYGQGAGAGFAGGTSQGRVRFIRLEYQGGDWDQDFGIGADLNMLVEYGLRTKQKVAERTESRLISQLANFPPEKSPPLVYMTGQKSIVVSNDEVKVLREYLLEKHGMLFGDNGGSRHFHNQFVAMMRRVLPNVDPVPVPLDDVIHRVPYQVPFLPYVAPHGGTDALGWRVEGRWVCYYHPGDIGDAWTDDHSGVPKEIYEACYQLGTNVIFYSHVEYSKWLSSRRKAP